ncbi:hypothetical protein BV22DRAFT_655249 [Leucogyrophana mollusca]|uniref:Uncharacterized protein n=1 Tax=Leucogyrophana mollusca TaxID=85980 RepID=A0ACB8B9X6_9AGAM|nr:hypothetical protein BV22DRAFT_655249 [Leucogyrophana mollusca]
MAPSQPFIHPSEHPQTEFSPEELYDPRSLYRDGSQEPNSGSLEAVKISQKDDLLLQQGIRHFKGEKSTVKPHSHSVLPNICYALHLLLIGIHICLLGLWTRHIEHRITVPIGAKSNVVSVGLTVVLQTFFTLYQAGMVATTQQLALQRNLLRHQTLTATHDNSGAWSGLGAALISLWRQIKIPAAVWGVLFVTLYLVCIAVLHVTSSSIMNLEVFNASYQATSQTTLGMPNLTNIFQATNDWSSTTAVASVVGQLSELSTIGVSNATVFDTLSDTSGVGNTTVNATTFGVDCFALPNTVATMDSDNLTFTVTSTVGDNQLIFMQVYPYCKIATIKILSQTTTFQLHPLLAVQNVLRAFPAAGTAPTPNRQVVFLGIPPIPDSQGNTLAGSTFPINRPINQAGANGVELNETVLMQATACSLYLTSQVATINAQTNELLEVAPSAPQGLSQWTQWQWPPADTPEDDSIDWFWMAFEQSTQSATFDTVDSDPCGDKCLLTMLETRLLKLLGWYPNPNPANQSTVSTPPVTLLDLETALANVAAAMVWTGARVNSSVPFSGEQFEVATGEATITKEFLESRLNINILPVAVGLGASIILFALATVLIHDPNRNLGHLAVGSAGILEIMWLSSRHTEVRERISEVTVASEHSLRAAGLFDVSFGRAPPSGHDS